MIEWSGSMYLRSLLDYLRQTASRLPEKTAFCDEKNGYTFHELLSLSARVGTAAARLTERVNQPVFVIVDRTAVSVLGLLSVLQAGCYYVPIDKKTPPERFSAMLQQIPPALILYAAQDQTRVQALAAGMPMLCIEQACETEPDEALLASRQAAVLDIDPAYGIFTSGSTGTPKGILICHRSAIDFTEWMAESCEIKEDEILGNQAPFYFDLSVKDLYQTLRCGTTTYILPQKFFMFPLLLADYLEEKRITTLIWATSAFRLVANSGVFEKKIPSRVSKIILGGEALQAVHLNVWRRALPGCRFINLYGPTEVTVDCTWFPIEREYSDGESIPIGKACRNMEVLLLDDALQPVAQGEVGEICVRGAGLAIGYFGDWEKTAKAFVQNPGNPNYPERLYRTGDLARMDADGNLIFLARKDDQVKHMGYRIELGEIETAIHALPEVEEAVCFFDKAADRIVCVCCGSLSDGEMMKRLQAALPHYMLPNVLLKTDALPHNANGKIDRAKLKKDYFDADHN